MDDDQTLRGFIILLVTILVVIIAMYAVQKIIQSTEGHEDVGGPAEERVIEKVTVYPTNYIENVYTITCKSAITGDTTDIVYTYEDVMLSEYEDSFIYWDWKTNVKEKYIMTNRICSIKSPVNLVVEAG